PSSNTAFNSSNLATSNDVATNKVANNTVLVSPRVGFNWDVNHDHKTQIRGGAVIFTVRIPFVWISNQYSTTGIGTANVSVTGTALQQVHFNPNNPYQPPPSTAPVVINVTDRNFKYPRSFRANLALDQRLPWGLIGSIEGIYTKTLQDINYKDL